MEVRSLAEIQSNLKVTRSQLAQFLESIGLSKCFVLRMRIDPHCVDVDIVAKDQDGNSVHVYSYGEPTPVYHSIRIPIVDE